MRIVQKFGGTSLQDPARILAAAKKAVTRVQRGDQVVVVVSAMGHTTDRILELVTAVEPVPEAREADMCLAAGEQLSAGLMALAIGRCGGRGVSLTGSQAGLLTDGNHGDARITDLTEDRIEKELEKGNIVVVAGFQGVSNAGDITTLGRGGSDTTAVALAAFLGAEVCQIYTDVDGVYDKDPKKDPAARRFDRIGYDDMLTLCRQGAQVLHDRCVELGKAYKVPIQVLSSFRPGPGTLVTDVQERVLPVMP